MPDNLFGNFDFQDVKDRVGGVISGALQTLDKPRGFVNAAIQLDNPIQGFIKCIFFRS